MARPSVSRLRIVTIAAAVGAAVLASPLAAQWTGTRLGGNAKRTNPEEVMQITARCVAKRGPAYAFKFLETLPGSEEEFRAVRRGEGDIGNCMDDSPKAIGSWEMSFTPRAFRRSLAGEFVQQMLVGFGDPAQLSTGNSWFVEAMEAAPQGTKFDGGYLAYMDFGDCVVAAAPASAVAFVSSTPETQGEGAALKALMPSLGPCISDGETIELTSETLRLALTEPLYHRLRAIKAES